MRDMEPFRAFTLLETMANPDANLLIMNQAEAWKQILKSKTGGFLRNEERQWNPPSMPTKPGTDFHQLFVDHLSPEVELAIGQLIIAAPSRMHLLFSTNILPKKKREILGVVSASLPFRLIEVTKNDNPEILFPKIADEVLESLCN